MADGVKRTSPRRLWTDGHEADYAGRSVPEYAYGNLLSWKEFLHKGWLAVAFPYPPDPVDKFCMRGHYRVRENAF
jgi:hypothetical protein